MTVNRSKVDHETERWYSEKVTEQHSDVDVNF